jgi:hypothetical protein
MSGARWLLHQLERVVESSYSVVRDAGGYETRVLVWAIQTEPSHVVHSHRCHLTNDNGEGAVRCTHPRATRG